MIDEIVELLPSADLKTKIRETNYRFTEEQLLQIIYRYAPTYDARLEMLGRFAEIASSDVSALAKVYVEYEQENFKRFTEAPEGFVYELYIKETPDSCEEKYLCSSYHAALVCIDRFYEEYADVDAKETDKTRYRILKRKIFSESDVFDEDSYAEVILGEHKAVLEVSDYKNPADCDSEIMCSECKEICPRRCDDVAFPCFVHNHDIIKYCDYTGKECFGVNLCICNGCDGMAEEFYIIPLDSSIIREHRFNETFYAHQHIELPLAALADPEDLDETMRRDYFAFIEFLDAEQA